MKFYILNLLLAAAVLAQKSCRTPKLQKGSCIPLNDCAELRKIIENKARTPQELRYLRNSACIGDKTQRNVQYVCCESASNPFQCTTPDLYEGTCKRFNDCPSAKPLIGSSKQIPKYVVDYLKEAVCNGDGKHNICCSENKPCVSHIKKPHPNVTSFFPKMDECGYDTPADRIIGGTEAGLGEFPWAVLIEYNKNGRLNWGCGGSLITEKYVLTAAHCVVGGIIRAMGNPSNIRLGEHDTTNTGIDCIQVDPTTKDCDEGTTTIEVEKVIPHPCYENKKLYDIALIRMKESVKFTDYIKPVCLPVNDITLGLTSTKLNAFTVVGWGTTETAKSSNVKLFAELPFSDQADCQRAYGKATKLISNQMCAGGVKGYDSCRGDSGGPLLYKHSDHYELTGVVSFGPTPCGKDGYPGVYSKVWNFMDWIKGEMEP